MIDNIQRLLKASSSRVPLYRVDLPDASARYAKEALGSTWISSKGDFIDKFESSLCSYLQVKHTICVSNGTAALHLALLALGVGPGDEVIVPNFSYIAAANSVVYVGATPVFADVSSSTGQLTLSSFKDSLTTNTKAVLLVHTYGFYSDDYIEIINYARSKSIRIIEDCAESLGTKFKNKHLGTYGDISTLSFFGNKTLTTGEGGAVFTNDSSLASSVFKLKGQGLSNHREYFHDQVGYNYRMTNICAAIGYGQFSTLDQTIHKKRMLYKAYIDNISHENLSPFPFCLDTQINPWLCIFKAQSHEQRDLLRLNLASYGIETRPGFPPASSMPMYFCNSYASSVSNCLANTIICLPSYPSISQSDLELVLTTIDSFFN